MDDSPTTSARHQAETLIEKLKEIHRELGTSPGPQRLEALRGTLQEALTKFESSEVPSIVAAAQEMMGKPENTEGASAGVLEEENRRLREEIDALRSCPQAETTISGAEALNALESIKDGLRRCTQGENISAEELDLPESEARLYRLAKELLRFALDYEVGLNALLFQFSIGVSSKFDTQIRKGFQRIVRDRFRACLEDKEGSLAALKESLQRNHRFLIDLNLSYDNCLRQGTRTMLEEMDPSPVVQEHKKWIGYDWNGAVRSLTRLHGDLSNLSREELWERFFYTPFREKLAGYLDMDDEDEP
jgi:hypothetical protein